MRVTPGQNNDCYCQSGYSFRDCCGAFIAGKSMPRTAEKLMRSRYTAFVLHDAAYLVKTWHPATRPLSLQLDDLKWLGLKVVQSIKGGAHDSEGVVEFVARYKLGGRASRLHEISRFERIGEEWFYLDGTYPD